MIGLLSGTNTLSSAARPDVYNDPSGLHSHTYDSSCMTSKAGSFSASCLETTCRFQSHVLHLTTPLWKTTYTLKRSHKFEFFMS